MKSNKIQKADMQLLAKLTPYTDPARIPLSFKYGETVINGIPEKFQPQITSQRADSNIKQVFIAAQIDKNLSLRVEYSEYFDFPVTEWVAYFTNNGYSGTEVITDAKWNIHMDGREPVLIHSNGDDCTYDGYEIYREALKTGCTMEIKPKGGTPCCGAFPYMRFLFEGYGVNLAIGWPGQWLANICADDSGVAFDVRQEMLHTNLLPGECVRTPRLNLVGFEGDENRGRNIWRRWYFKHIIPKENGNPIPPMFPLTNSAGGIEFTEATEQNQLEAIDYYIKKGVKPDIWWIDAGWYPCDLNWVKAGSWYPNPEHFPNGMDSIGQKCAENDIRFLLWFETERVTEGSALDKEHPEWLLYLKEETGNISWTRMLNLSIPDAQDWLIALLDNYIKKYQLKIYRQDFNMHESLTFWSQKETDANRRGLLENKHIQGLLRVWDTILERNPGLWIDNCSSGGRRNDLELMRRSVPLHYTDVGYGVHPMKQQQYRLMFDWIPYFRSPAANWDRPDGSYNEAASPFDPVYADDFSYYCAMAPAVSSYLRMNSSDEEFAVVRKMLSIWRPAAELMIGTDYYPLIESHKSAKEYYACQFNDPEKRKGFIQVIRNTQAEQNSVTIYPFVDKNADYRFRCMDPDLHMDINGGRLAEKGMEFNLPKRSSIIWFYEY